MARHIVNRARRAALRMMLLGLAAREDKVKETIEVVK